MWMQRDGRADRLLTAACDVLMGAVFWLNGFRDGRLTSIPPPVLPNPLLETEMGRECGRGHQHLHEEVPEGTS